MKHEGELVFRVDGSTVYDAYRDFGITLEESSLSKLMTPAPNKAGIENKSDIEHGKRVVMANIYCLKTYRSRSCCV